MLLTLEAGGYRLIVSSLNAATFLISSLLLSNSEGRASLVNIDVMTLEVRTAPLVYLTTRTTSSLITPAFARASVTWIIYTKPLQALEKSHLCNVCTFIHHSM